MKCHRVGSLLAHPIPALFSAHRRLMHLPLAAPSSSMPLPIVILYLLFGYVLFHGGRISAGETVTYKGPEYVNEGDIFAITCQMSRFLAPKWTHNERPIEESSKRMTFDSEESVDTTRIEKLTIENARFSDAGFYRCNSFTRNAHFVNVIPLQTRQTTVNNTLGSSILYQVLEEENSRIEINCPLDISNPKAPVTWRKNSVYIDKDSRRYPVGSRLVIENATSDRDAGQYLCQTDNMQAEGGTRFGQIIHLRAPVKVKPFKEAVVNKVQKESLRVTCRYSGFPAGTISWIIGNNRLNENELKNEGIQVEADRQGSDTLVINQLTMRHSNLYTCLVDNTLTKSEASFLLQVRENQVLISNPLVLIENRELRINCSTKSSIGSDNEPKWLKDSIDVTQLEGYENRMRIERVEESGQRGELGWVLVIENAQISDVGNYTCVHNQINATTRVRSKPLLYPFEEYQMTNYKSANVVEGERFSLRCALAPGYERDADLQWYMYREEDASLDHLAAHLLTLINTSDSRIRIESNDSTVSVLTISAVAPQDRFFYVCKSHNDVASYNNTILLRVKDKLAALWPFLGIVTEVLILCIVIFVYEKRRVKPDFDEPVNQNRNDEGRKLPV